MFAEQYISDSTNLETLWYIYGKVSHQGKIQKQLDCNI